MQTQTLAHINKDSIDVVTARVLPFQEHTMILNCKVGKGSFKYSQVRGRLYIQVKVAYSKI